ncbi:hypothetical protein SMC26_17285 [Actinomadura fulvescens]|uniref:Uncharacterized protein n=1 Tax=Actinomadura fulvescens TaxID=46160 RepID=A0ABP6CQG5_9ACTN
MVALITRLFAEGCCASGGVPRIITGYPDLFLEPFLEPEPLVGGDWDCRELITMLSPPARWRQEEPVWHSRVHISPEELLLDEEGWAQVALAIAIQNGVAINDGFSSSIAPCTAIQHADNHIHIVIRLHSCAGDRLLLSRDHLQVAHACAVLKSRFRLAASGNEATYRDREASAAVSKASRTVAKGTTSQGASAPRDREGVAGKPSAGPDPIPVRAGTIQRTPQPARRRGI